MVAIWLITPQHERGELIGVGVHIYICIYAYMFVDKKNMFESYFSDRLTFSNIRSRTSCQIYRLALPLLFPETLSSSSKSRILVYNATLLYLSDWMPQLPAQKASVSIVI